MLSAAKPVYPLPQCTICTHTLVDRTTTPAATILAVAYDKNFKKNWSNRRRRPYQSTNAAITYMPSTIPKNPRHELYYNYCAPQWSKKRTPHKWTRVHDETKSSDAFLLRKRLQLTSQRLRRFLGLNYNDIVISVLSINIFVNNNKIVRRSENHWFSCSRRRPVKLFDSDCKLKNTKIVVACSDIGPQYGFYSKQ